MPSERGPCGEGWIHGNAGPEGSPKREKDVRTGSSSEEAEKTASVSDATGVTSVSYGKA